MRSTLLALLAFAYWAGPAAAGQPSPGMEHPCVDGKGTAHPYACQDSKGDTKECFQCANDQGEAKRACYQCKSDKRQYDHDAPPFFLRNSPFTRATASNRSGSAKVKKVQMKGVTFFPQ